MKKLLMLVLAVFMVSACSNNADTNKVEDNNKEEETTTQPETKKSAKLYEDKDYLIAVDTYEIPFAEEQKTSTAQVDDKIISYEINLASDFAKEITNELQAEAKSQIENVQIGDGDAVQRCTSLMGNEYVSDKYVSFVFDYFNYVYQSDGSNNASKAYVFDKESGTLKSNDNILADFNLTSDQLIEKITAKITSEGSKICGDRPGECYFEPTYSQGEEATQLYVDENGHLVVYVKKSMGLAFEWTALTLD